MHFGEAGYKKLRKKAYSVRHELRFAPCTTLAYNSVHESQGNHTVPDADISMAPRITGR